MSLGGVVIVAILIFCYSIVGFRIAQENRKLGTLKKEYELLRPEYEKVCKLKADKEKLEAKILVMDKLLAQRLLWSRKLNQLSDLMSPQVWLSSLAVISNPTSRMVEGKEVQGVSRSLLIRGKTYSNKGEKMVEQVGDFIRRIEEDEPFFKDFVNVELISTEREAIGPAEVMRFEVTCQFK